MHRKNAESVTRLHRDLLRQHRLVEKDRVSRSFKCHGYAQNAHVFVAVVRCGMRDFNGLCATYYAEAPWATNRAGECRLGEFWEIVWVAPIVDQPKSSRIVRKG